MAVQSLLSAIYPPSCLACEEPTEAVGGLCPGCWGDTHFLRGVLCSGCGAPLLGEADPDEDLRCDDCLRVARPWDRGRAAVAYAGVGRRLVLGLKHGDRTDLAPDLARWMVQAAGDMLDGDPFIVPVPLHWTRLFRRRYNQAGLLAQAIARQAGLTAVPDALIRVRRTPPLEGKDRAARFKTLLETIAPHPRRGSVLAGRAVVIVDDVMTSGATFAAATEAAHAAGASRVSVLALARVVKDL